MATRTLTIGTRGSLLAVAQTELVADLLRSAHSDLSIRIERIVTRGDRQQKVSLPEIGGKGLFTAELEAALLDGSIDLAVHSAKDLPTEMPAGLILAATPSREDPRDVLISRAGRRLDDLPPQAVLGTSSLRRQAQLLAHRPDLRFTVLRGNVDTRIRKVMELGQCDATLLARAGLIRTGLTEPIAEVLDIDRMVPAAGQGALALQTRTDDDRVRSLLAAIHEEATATALACERKVVELLHGGCQAPIGAHARLAGDRLDCVAVVLSPDGRQRAEARADAPVRRAHDLAETLVERLRSQGAEEILRTCR
ncbi:MAG: hydroxymethylbilane synthase [Phycisphaerae bacterium]|nr:hydroxymethylbilane synthase [Phycisphaerae bacterium]